MSTELDLISALLSTRICLIKALRRLELKDPYVWEIQEIEHTIGMIDQICKKVSEPAQLGDGSEEEDHWLYKKRP